MEPESKRSYSGIGLVVAMFFHGAYDFVLFTQTILGLLIIPIIIWLYRIHRKRLYMALKDSPFRDGRDKEAFRKS